MRMTFSKLIPLLILVTCYATPFTLATEERRVVSQIITDAVLRKNVDIDVLVTDTKGQPVLGLTPADFELSIDGKTVTIESCNSAAQEGSGPGENPMAMAVFFDELNTSSGARETFLDALTPLIANDIPPGSRVMVTSFDPGLAIRHASSKEPESVALTLDQLREEGPERTTISDEQWRFYEDLVKFSQKRINTEHLIEELRNSNSFGQSIVEIERTTADASDKIRDSLQKVLQQLNARETELTEALATTIDSLAATPGHKTLFFVSRGIPTNLGWELVEYAKELKAITEPFASTCKETFNLNANVQDIIRRANGGRITIYPINLKNPPSGGDDQVEAKPSLPPDRRRLAMEAKEAQDREHTLLLFASATGGRCLSTASTLASDITQIVEGHTAFYTLEFPAENVTESGYHKISLKVFRPNCTLRYREGIWTKKTKDRLADLAKAVIRLDHNENPVDFQAQPGQPMRKNGALILPITLHIPTDKLTFAADDLNYHARLVVGTMVRNPHAKNPYEFITTIFNLDIPKAEFTGKSQQETTLDVSLKVHPGNQKIAIVLSDDNAGVDSATAIPINVAEK